MQRFFRQFKLSLIATAIAFCLMIVLGLIMLGMTIEPGVRNAEERAGMLGQGLATLTCIIITPFWIYDAYQAGKERREALKKSAAKSKSIKNPRKKSNQ